MQIEESLLIASIIIFIGFIGSLLLNRKNIPDSIFLILFGFLLGPLLHIVDPQQLSPLAPIVGALALIAIMFESSMGIDLNELLLTAKQALILSLAGFAASVFITYVFLYYIVGFAPDNPLYSILIGVIIGGGSGAVIASIAPRISMPNSLQITVSLESVLTDVYVIIFSLTILSILAGKGENIPVSMIAGSIVAKFSTSVIMGFIAGLILADLIYRFKREQHLYIMVFAYLILLYVGAEFLMGSGAITVLTAGIVVANIQYLPRFLRGSGEDKVDIVKYQLFSMESAHTELTLLIRIFFFVEVGLVLNLTNIDLILKSLILSLLLLAIRYPIAYGVTRSLGFRHKNGIAALVTTFFYARGLAAAVMAIWAAQETITINGVTKPLLPPTVSEYVIGIASAVVLFTNIILTLGVASIKNKVRELLF